MGTRNRFSSSLVGFMILLTTLLPASLTSAQSGEEGKVWEQSIISDDRLIMTSQLATDLSDFLAHQSPILSTLEIGSCNGTNTLANQLEFIGNFYGIDPRVMLTLLELKTKLLSNPNPTDEMLQWAMGNRDPQYIGLAKQLQWSAEFLISSFEAHYFSKDKNQLEIVFADGTRRLVSPNINSSTYALQRFLARDTTFEEWTRLIGKGPGSFYAIYRHYFGEPLGTDLRVTSPQGFPSNMELRLPWTMGEPWYFWSGPHRTNPNDTVWAAVDWGPEDVECSPSRNRTSSTPVRAARGGIVVYAGCNFVRVDHGSGWSTGYFHLDNILVTTGQNVSTGSPLGYPSCLVGQTCGWSGSSDRPHVHFDIRYNNIRQPIAGTIISGWTINAGSTERSGSMIRSGSPTVYPRGRVTSDNSSDSDDGRTISAGQTLVGNISPAGDQDLYYYDGNSGQEITIEMTRSSGNLDPYIILYRPNGSYLNYDDDSAGYPNARLVIRLPDSGRYTIRAKSFASYQSGAYTLRVTAGSGGRDTDDGRWLAHDRWLDGRIDPSNDEDWYYFNGIQGRIVSIRMNKSGVSLDSWLELYDPNGSFVTHDDDGGGWDTRNAWLVTVLPRTGIYRVKARSYNHNSSGAYTIRLRMVDANNYALNKPAYTSSVESAVYAPFRAFDGRLDTRWSSRFSDPQWIYVDLGQNRTFDTVILRWETAYARRYGIYVWTGTYWRNVFRTDNGRGGTVMIRFPMTTGRYVMMYGLARGTPWGYSLWEFGVYNSTEATAPIVPPPDPEKEPDNIAPLPPSPLPEEEAGKEVLALYFGDGENAQEVEALPGEGPGSDLEGTVGQEGLPIATIEAIHPANDWIIRPNDTVEFYGSATDNDAEGDPGIIAYEWRSDKDGLLSNQAVFTVKGSILSPGEHIISFRAQDNEGNWSEWDQKYIQVLQNYQVYLPLLLRNR